MTNNEQGTGPESVERIRDIIFGPQMRDYDQRFEALVRDLSRLQQELDRLNEQLAAKDAAQGRNLQALRQELRQANSEQQTALKAEADQLNTQLADQASAQESSLQSLRQELRQADADLREELRQLARRLTADKTDRATLGDLFIELGNHVKTGGSLADLLQGLDQPG